LTRTNTAPAREADDELCACRFPGVSPGSPGSCRPPIAPARPFPYEGTRSCRNPPQESPISSRAAPTTWSFTFVAGTGHIVYPLLGTTKIGKYVLNHSFMIPGRVSTTVAVATGLFLARLMF
jgi:hypothetical protein